MILLAIVLSLVIWGLIFYILWWGQAKMEIPDPFNKAITVLLVIAAIVIVVGLLTGAIPPFAFLSSALSIK